MLSHHSNPSSSLDQAPITSCMAADAIALQHEQSNQMSSRRPLANNPTAVNSPYRATSAAVKRPRTNVYDKKDIENPGSPPKKRQAIEQSQGIRRVHHVSHDEREGRVFLDRNQPTPPNAFTKKLTAIRDAKQALTRAAQKAEVDVETVKQWRKHYRKVCPTFVFYLENLPQDVAIKASKQIQHLGAVRKDVDGLEHNNLTRL